MHVPVPWVFVLAYLVGLGLQVLFPFQIHEDAAIVRTAGFLLLAIGGIIAAWCLTIFARRRTTTVPFGVSSELVTSGPYQFSRNPMYVGLTLIYLGEAAVLDQLWPLLPLFAVLAYLDKVVIPYEESRLRATFGQEYERYGARVRRWVGRY